VAENNNLTFGIIKPDAVLAGNIGIIIQRILDSGFRIRGLKLLHMTRREAEGFYAVHRERPFFAGLTEFMSSGPCIVMALEKEAAVKAWRDLMGATDPAKADVGTLRKEFGASVGENAVHGSDSDENASIEIAYFFSQLEIV
jgi:nucleoside-diphosphate kinase